MKNIINKLIAATGNVLVNKDVYQHAMKLSEMRVEKSLQRIVTDPESVFFDVGAHRGESVQLYKNLFPKSIVHAFEPDPENFSELETLYGKNPSIFLNRVGIGDEPGNLPLNKTAFSPTNSYLSPNEGNSKVKGLKSKLNAESFVKEVVNTEVTTLDQYCQEKSIERIHYLKIDTQGFEEKCIKGGLSIINSGKVDAIQVEIILTDMYNKTISFLDIEKYLIPAGYELFGVYDISIESRKGRLAQLDAIYVKRDKNDNS